MLYSKSSEVGMEATMTANPSVGGIGMARKTMYKFENYFPIPLSTVRSILSDEVYSQLKFDIENISIIREDERKVPIGKLIGILGNYATEERAPRRWAMSLAGARGLVAVQIDARSRWAHVEFGLGVLPRSRDYLADGEPLLGEMDRGRKEAVERLREHLRAPDLIISDYRIAPDHTCIDAIRMIRGAQGAEIPGLLITGDSSLDDLRAVAASGWPVAYKPLSATRLCAAIAERLARPAAA